MQGTHLTNKYAAISPKEADRLTEMLDSPISHPGRVRISSLILVVVAITPVSASRFYEARGYEVWTGINQGCSKLSNDWCFTDCDVFRENCNFCKYTKA